MERRRLAWQEGNAAMHRGKDKDQSALKAHVRVEQDMRFALGLGEEEEDEEEDEEDEEVEEEDEEDGQVYRREGNWEDEEDEEEEEEEDEEMSDDREEEIEYEGGSVESSMTASQRRQVIVWDSQNWSNSRMTASRRRHNIVNLAIFATVGFTRDSD